MTSDNLPRTRFDGGAYPPPVEIRRCRERGCTRPATKQCEHKHEWLCEAHQWTCAKCGGMFCESCALVWAEMVDGVCHDCRAWTCDDCGRQHSKDVKRCMCAETPGAVTPEEQANIDAICEREARHTAALFGKQEENECQ